MLNKLQKTLFALAHGFVFLWNGLVFLCKHSLRILMYAAFLWIFIISQFFAYKWITTNGDSFNSLMGYTQKEDVVTMTVDELIGTIAKTAVAEIKK